MTKKLKMNVKINRINFKKSPSKYFHNRIILYFFGFVYTFYQKCDKINYIYKIYRDNKKGVK